jgi:hypothetical protein
MNRQYPEYTEPTPRGERKSSQHTMRIVLGISVIASMSFSTFLLGSGTGRAQDEPGEPAVAGRPADYSGLVGSYQVATSANPTELSLDDPVTLTVTLTAATGSAPAPGTEPRRANLRAYTKSLANDFYLQDLPDAGPQHVGVQTWSFSCRLKLKRAGVSKVPALKLSYFDPQFRKYQVAYARAIPLRVKAQAAAKVPGESAEATDVPDQTYQVVTGPALLRSEQPARWSSPASFCLLLLVPPLLCAGGYGAWRLANPQGPRLARRKRSQAAQQAVKRFRGFQTDHQVREHAAVVVDYLRQRFGLSIAEPTPAEIHASVRRASISPRVAGQLADLFHRFDALRFAPQGQFEASQLEADAQNVIMALEAEPWRSHSC